MRIDAYRIRRGLLFAVLATAAFATTIGFADPKPAKPTPAAHGKAAAPGRGGKKRPPKSTNGQVDGGAATDPAPPSPATAAAGGGSATSDAGVVTTQADGGAKQFRFGELEIEGRLKSPQLVYFLRRVRAEFSAGDLGHRSFFPELSETEGDPSFGGGP